MKNSPKGVVPIQIEGIDSTRVVAIPHTRKSGGRTTTILPARRPSNRRRPPHQALTQRPRARRVVTTRSRAVTHRATTNRAKTTSGGRRHHTSLYARIRRCGQRGGGPTSWVGRAGRGRRPTPRRFLPNRDLTPLDEHLPHCSERGDSQARSCRPAEPVAQAAPAGEPTPGAGTLVDEHAEGAANSSGAVRPGTARQQPKMLSPQLHPTGHETPDRLRNNLARSCKEGVGQGEKLRADRNCRGRPHPQPTVTAILGGTKSFHTIPATPSRPPTSLP